MLNNIFTPQIFVILFIFACLYYLTNIAFAKLLKKHNNLTNSFLHNATKTFLIIACIISILIQFDSFEKILNTLLSNTALIVAVLGFLLQNTLKNIIAGILLLSSDTFKVGDRIRLPDKEVSGVIEELTMRHTTVKLQSNERAIIPNSLLNDSLVINSNLVDDEIGYPLIVPISLNKDVTRAKEIVEEEIKNNSNVLQDLTSNTILTTLTKDSIEIKTVIWTRNLEDSFSTVSDLRENIVNKLREEKFY